MRHSDDILAAHSASRPTVFVVDDHEAERSSLLTLLASVGIDAVGFDCGVRFLDSLDGGNASCALLEIRLPDIGGLAVAREIRARGHDLPFAFVSAHADVRLAVEAMQLGAEAVIEKPYRDQEIIDRVQCCLELDRDRRAVNRRVRDVYDRLRALSARERLVLEHMLLGEANKDIAEAVHLSRRTIETHRAHLMRKMQASSLATLVATVTWARTVAPGVVPGVTVGAVGAAAIPTYSPQRFA